MIASGGDQEDVPEAPDRVTREGVAIEASLLQQRHRNRGSLSLSRDEPGGCPPIGQAVSGAEAA